MRPRLFPIWLLYSLLFVAAGWTAAATQPDAPVSGQSAATGQVFDATIGGRAQRVLFAAPPHPLAMVVMFPGGAGDIGMSEDGGLRHAHNFVVRSRDLWTAAGFAVLIPDTVDRENLRGQRASPRYAETVAGLVALAHERTPGKVFLLGTSQGAIAAMNGAAHLRDGQIAGLVLSESVTRLGGSHETVFDAHPERVNVPALMVANSDDRCKVAPPLDAPKIAAALTRSPQVTILNVSGGRQTSSRTCGSLTPHGYDGIEPSVVNSIAAWMRQRL